MKKLNLLCLTLLVASVRAFADPVDLNKARAIAMDFLGTNCVPQLVKSAERAEAKSRRLNDEIRKTSPYYIFSRGTGQGYVIVSGDDCAPKILGYTESGDFDEANMPPYLLGWLDDYANRIVETQIAGMNKSRSLASDEHSNNRVGGQLLEASNKEDVPVLMTTHWHQTGPYNNHCPFLKGTQNRAVTGCVATAAAQVVYYYHKDNPDELLSTTPTYSYGEAPVTDVYPKGTPIFWDLMLDSYNSSRPKEFDDAVSIFTAALGAATWLTYGSSTSGQISDLVNTFNSYFNISSKCQYKESMATAAWENLIYKDLIAGRPIVYSGYNEGSGGHAVVVDGYQSSTNLFHFNFGWGGQGDGWYTVDNETGMNGFNQYQGMVYNITPKKLNLEANVIMPENVYYSRSNKIKVNVTNNGTLPYSGIYVFANTNGNKPTSLSQAKDENEDLMISPDGNSVEIELSVKPTTEDTWHFYVTDNKLNILAKAEAETLLPSSKLQLDGMEIDGSTLTEEHSGHSYDVVFNSRATCLIDMSNNCDIPFEGNPRLAIYSSDDDGNTFTFVGNKSVSVDLDANRSGRFSLNITNTTSCPIESGKLYYGVLVNPIESAKTTDYIEYATTDTIVRFVLKEKTLTEIENVDGCLSLEGDWDVFAFNNILKKNANKNATSFDLTKVNGIKNIPEIEDKPNALFYVAENSKAVGNNVIRKESQSCDVLKLKVGYDFVPNQSFVAKNVVLDICQKPNYWYLLTSPCRLNVPNGILARRIDSHNSTGISGKTTNVDVLEAGQTYLVITTSEKNQYLTSTDAEVVKNPVENVDTAFVGTFINTVVTESSFLLNFEEKQMFSPVEEGAEVEAMRGFFHDKKNKREFRAYSSIVLDPLYLDMGNTISSCYDLLDEYDGILTEEALSMLTDSIRRAEEVFTGQILESASDIKNYVSNLSAFANNLKSNVDYESGNVDVDFTDMINNPSFEESGIKGWTTDNKYSSVKNASTPMYRGVGANGNNLFYSINSADSTGVELSQTVRGLIPGKYTLSAKLCTDKGETVTLFAGDRETTVQSHKFGKFYFTDARIEDIEISEGDELTIGVKAGHWYKADDFRLVYNGPTDEIINSVESAMGKPELSIKAVDGGITITAPEYETVRIYNASGMHLMNREIEGTEMIHLDPGFYIINGSKVVVK